MNCLVREAQGLSLAFGVTVSKAETKPVRRLGTGTQSEELKLREEGAPTQGKPGAPTPFQSQVWVAILSAPESNPFPLCPPQGSSWVGLLPCLPGLALPRMTYPHIRVDEPLCMATVGPRQDQLSCLGLDAPS